MWSSTILVYCATHNSRGNCRECERGSLKRCTHHGMAWEQSERVYLFILGSFDVMPAVEQLDNPRHRIDTSTFKSIQHDNQTSLMLLFVEELSMRKNIYSTL